MALPALERTTFETSRLLEFFSEKELQMQIGFQPSWWPLALVKELIDNSLDACESAGITPEIDVVIEPDFVTVKDNGPGLPPGTLERSLDYAIRVSDKANYVSPTRGQLGNALKCLWAAPYVANGDYGHIEVTTGGQTHLIDVTLDRIGQRPQIAHSVETSAVKDGTIVRIDWPEIASYLEDDEEAGFYRLARAYAVLNPHMKLNEVQPTQPSWEKWRPNAPTSPHWYTAERLRALIAAYLNDERHGGRARTVREFVSEFSGLTGTQKQKAVTKATGLSGAYLHDIVDNDDVNLDLVVRLLDEMQRHSRPIKPSRLGTIGKGHLTSHLEAFLEVDSDSVRYIKRGGCVGGLPYVLEVAFGINSRNCEKRPREDIIGLNWSPTLRIPVDEIHDFLAASRVDEFDPVVVVVHMACPRFEYVDKSKSALHLPKEMLEDLECGIAAVTKKWIDANRCGAGEVAGPRGVTRRAGAAE